MQNKYESEGQLIKLALGTEWNQLSEKIRARFEQDPIHNAPKFYSGTMTEVKCSTIGKALAYFTKFIHAPLIPYSQTNVPIEVKVYKKENRPDVFKSRIYYFEGRKPFEVESFMSINQKGEFVEFVNSWLGMKLKLYTKDGNLHFEGINYFIKIANFELPLPIIFSPGKAYIKHSDYGDDSFIVRIEMIHPLLGQMFSQEGIFKEKL